MGGREYYFYLSWLEGLGFRAQSHKAIILHNLGVQVLRLMERVTGVSRNHWGPSLQTRPELPTSTLYSLYKSINP